MALTLNSIKLIRITPSAIFKWYHVSSPLSKWPARLSPIQVKVTERKVKIWENMTLWDLAKSMRKDLTYINEVLKPVFDNKINSLTGQIQDLNFIQKFLRENKIDFSVIPVHIKSEETRKRKEKEVKTPTLSENEVKRPPVVTIMGHVDHGKTTLLDALRNSNIVESEFGGITQHIGAFSVTWAPGKTITFIDTPGHSAFSAMRNRGAGVTDIVVLIVAADDGVMEQTVESISMAINAGVKIIVAVNKIDKAENTMSNIKQQMLREGIQAEDLGGDVQFVPISALKKINLNLLIEAILVEADMMGLTGDPTSPVEGVIIESSVGKRGKEATMIIKRGTLRKRAMLVAGASFARVRGIYDEYGSELSQATLSQPVLVLGWRNIPNAGEKVYEVMSQKEASLLIREYEKEQSRQKILKNFIPIQEKAVQERAEFVSKKSELTTLKASGDVEGLKKFFASKPMVKEEGPKLNIIVKGDVDGSVDAILDVLSTYDYHKECKLNLVHHGVGVVTESDLDLAQTFDAIIYCFNLSFPKNLKEEITEKKIAIKFYNVIYKLIEDLKKELSDRIPIGEEDDIIGTGEVLQNFVINEGKRAVPVAGSACLTGEFRTKSNFRIIRNEEIIFEGLIRCLKHFKNEVNTVKKGSQCGIMLEGFSGEFKEGDKIICFDKKSVQYETSWNPGF